MGLPIKTISLGFLKNIIDDDAPGVSATEYRDSISSEVKLKGPGIEENKELIKEAFMLWYPPQGYMSSTSEDKAADGSFVLVLNRYLNCD